MSSSLLVAIAGLPGSGKTTIREFLEAQGFLGLDRDRVLFSLFPHPDSSDRSQKTAAFIAMLDQAKTLLEQGKRVTIETGFARAADLAAAKSISDTVDVPFKIIHCVCPDEIAVARIQAEQNPYATDRTPELYFEVKARFEPITLEHLLLDTSQPESIIEAICLRYLAD